MWATVPAMFPSTGTACVHAADLEERATWMQEQAGYTVTTQLGHGYRITTAAGYTIATPASLDELRALADQPDEPVWLSYRQVQTA